LSVLVTGSAGFIGASLVKKLLIGGRRVIGIDNHNDYYDPSLKDARADLNLQSGLYHHVKMSISDKAKITECFEQFRPKIVVNLAAQAGVRYSIQRPEEYVQTNLVGFANILEACRHFDVSHLVYASSSSVYGANSRLPFSVHDNVDHPLSLYAASKKCNELMAHSYSYLYDLPTTGMRFFTVYGPWGRPDMALFKFTSSIIAGEPIEVFNFGNHRRDFTYIDDITDAIIKIIDSPAKPDLNWSGDDPDPGSSKAPWRVYNIGNSSPVKLKDYIVAIENAVGKKAIVQMLPLQKGDVPDTHADVSDLVNDFGFQPSTSIELGITKFVEWYRDYYGV
jgi:UDP-glucuronate 4-epimerase